MILRDYQVSDRNELSLICSDIEVMKYVFNGPIPINEFDAFIENNFSSSKMLIGLEVISHKKNNEIMGFAGFHKFFLFKQSIRS